MSKIKVLQVIGSLKVGGAEKVSVNLYRYINRNKYEFHYLVYGSKIEYFEKEIKELGGKVIHIDSPSKGYRNFKNQVLNVMESGEKYDIVHCHTLFNSGMVLEIAKKVGVKKRISHSHTVKNKVKDNVLTLIYQWIMKNKILKNSNKYLACSADAGAFLYGSDNFIQDGLILKNGIEIQDYKFNEDVRRKIRKEIDIEEEILLGHVGRLSSVKNQLFLLDVFKVISETNENYKLVLVGEGEDRNLIIDRIEKYGLKSQVLVVGNRSDVNKVLNAIDIFIFPSKYEGLGISLIEAQASGLPCLVSDNIPEEAIVTDLVETLPLTLSKNEWANSILSLSINKNRFPYYQKVGEEGYDISLLGDNLEEIYSSL